MRLCHRPFILSQKKNAAGGIISARRACIVAAGLANRRGVEKTAGARPQIVGRAGANQTERRVFADIGFVDFAVVAYLFDGLGEACFVEPLADQLAQLAFAAEQSFALWFGLTVYTAAFIAENVRGGILSVAKGQTEAARSLGLHHTGTLKLVVIPQAMRVIIPPTISQFLNLTKNSSLAVAIGYPEVVNVWAGISLNQTGQSLVIMAMTIAVYWTLSLLTSATLNWYNARVQLQGR